MAAAHALGSYISPDAVCGPPSRRPGRKGLYIDAVPSTVALRATDLSSSPSAANGAGRARAAAVLRRGSRSALSAAALAHRLLRSAACCTMLGSSVPVLLSLNDARGET